jgi:hypothetical protein
VGTRNRQASHYAALTRRRFESAVMGLACTRPLSAIAVRSICIRAGMGRHAFYPVFDSLEEARALASEGQKSLHAPSGRRPIEGPYVCAWGGLQRST